MRISKCTYGKIAQQGKNFRFFSQIRKREREIIKSQQFLFIYLKIRHSYKRFTKVHYKTKECLTERLTVDEGELIFSFFFAVLLTSYGPVRQQRHRGTKTDLHL
jgi:hypothetical protein